MTERLRRAGQLCWAVVGVAALLAVLGALLWTVRVIFPPLIFASAVVFLLNPVVTTLQRRHIPRAAGTGLAYLGVFGVVALAGFVVVPLAVAQGEELADDWPMIEAKAERWVDDRAEQSRGTFWEFTRAELEGAFSNDNLPLREQLDRVLRVGEQVFHVLLILVLTPVIAFYLLVDLPHIRDVSESLVPAGARDEILHVSRRLNRAVGGFFRGQLAVAVIVGIMCSVGLAVIGLRFWFLIGMIAGFFNVIPLIGPWVGGIPGVMIALTTGSPVQALLVVAVMAGVQQIDNHFITPQVMQRAVQLHPAAVILALLAGGSLAGFFGLLFAVPAAAMLKIIAGHVWRVHVLGEPLPAVGDDEGPGLVQDVVGGDGADERAPADGRGTAASRSGSAPATGSRGDVQESSRSTTSATPSP
ncbi:MAG: AI-2E family transporter [Actinomycetota bacterium]|nr:AI-2E family transporter [Actinomycetota bacterium]